MRLEDLKSQTDVVGPDRHSEAEGAVGAWVVVMLGGVSVTDCKLADNKKVSVLLEFTL